MLLSPGTHLVELIVRKPMAPDLLEEALAMMGFTNVFFDAQPGARDSGNWTPDPFNRDLREFGRWRFIGQSSMGLRCEDTDGVGWLHAHTLCVDPYTTDAAPEAQRAEVKAGETYDLFFASWLKTVGGRSAVEKALRDMRGFHVLKTACMKTLMRFPDRPGADGALWYARGTWTGADSILGDEPLFFYQVERVHSDA